MSAAASRIEARVAGRPSANGTSVLPATRDLRAVLALGLMLVAAAAVADAIRSRTDVEPASQWLREYREANAQFSRLLVALACVVGVPLLIGGFVDVLGGGAAATATTAAAALLPGAALLRWLWTRWPDRRLDSSWWASQARVGNGGRRRSVALLLLALAFVIVCALLVAAADRT